MAYDDDKCPCGGEKPTQSLICQACWDAFSDSLESRVYWAPEGSVSVSSRRTAAVRLLSMARGRRQQRAAVGEQVTEVRR